MSDTLTLANAELVLRDRTVRGRLTARAGEIVEIAPGADVPAGAVDCEGDYVLPGLVELHTDNLERHMEPRPGVDWPHLPAIIAHDAELASTGITTVFDALRVGSAPGGKARYDAYARRLADQLLAVRGHLKVDHYIHLRAEICSQTLLEEIAEFGEGDSVGIVSLMDHTPGQRQFRDVSALRKYLAKKRSMTEPEFQAHLARMKAMRAEFGDRHEAGAVEEAQRIGAVLASHDDTTAGQVATSARHGVRFAEFPTTVEAARACRQHGIAVMMGAPNVIRGGSHSGNVAAEDLARLDLLDILSSDYVPAALLLSTFRLAALWGDLARAVSCATRAPAQAAGLLDRGQLAEGLRADLLRVATLEGTPIVRGVWSAGRQIG